MFVPNGTKCVARGARIDACGAGIPVSGIEMTVSISRRRPKDRPGRARLLQIELIMAAFLGALALTVVSSGGSSYGVVTQRGRDGRPYQWVKRVSASEYQILIDSNGDGKPDVIKTFRNNEIVEIQSDRNFDGHVDLVQLYAHGVIVREIRDDDFDGRPETVKTFRPDGTLAIVERDPAERGAISVVEYYDRQGHMTRREMRAK
jgi:hypothetical protein